MTVDGLPALCTGLACDYVYEEATGVVTGMSIGTPTPVNVTLSGSDLPLELASVTLAKTNCIVTSHNETSIVCYLETPWVAGSWYPEVRDDKGLIPVSIDVTAHHVPLIVTGVSPDTDLNQAGGD